MKALLSTKDGLAIVERVSVETGIPVIDILDDGNRSEPQRARYRVYQRMFEAGASVGRIGFLMQRDKSGIARALRGMRV